MKERCKVGTLDAIIIGGRDYSDSDSDLAKKLSQEYVESIKFISTEVKKIFDFEPIVINGPKLPDTGEEGDDVYYDNANRRLYLLRPEVNKNVGSFPASEIDKEKRKWDKGL
jgi:hypothetical protein